MSRSDIRVIIDVVARAVRSETSCAASVEQRLASNSESIRRWRDRARDDHFLTDRPQLVERRIACIQADSRRIRRLMRTYASWQVAS